MFVGKQLTRQIMPIAIPISAAARSAMPPKPSPATAPAPSRRSYASTSTVAAATGGGGGSSSTMDSSGGHPKPLYASQSSLPHLPVPPLASTLHKYLETLAPLQTRDEHDASARLVHAFGRSAQAAELQRRLEARAAERESWLSEWWNEAAYMGYRDRLVPNVSYFYIHKRGLGKGKSQERRAAELVRAVVEFKKLVDSERLEPEKVKGQPLCMSSYKYLSTHAEQGRFNAARIPTRPADVPLAHPAELNHIVVLRKGRYFKVDARGNADNLEAAFKEIKAMATSAGENPGVLTNDNRDVWTDRLVELGNEQTLVDIESAILLVSLDDNAPSGDDARAWSYWAGGVDGSPRDKGRNRWFDKHNLIIDEAGESGFNGEHSMLDGTPTLRLNEFMLASLDKGMIPLDGPSVPASPRELVWQLDDDLRALVARSASAFGAEISRQDVRMLTYTGYGKSTIKTFNVSPDAWAQMVKQLAFHRLFGRPAVTYESCQTRKFKLGRTEVIRAASAEAKAWVESMCDDSGASDRQREALFRKACARHTQYSAWAADAQGVDRHMFGLKRLVQDGEAMPAIFTDPAYAKSSHWELSTSQLTSEYLDGWGYGEVVPDGYGLSYSIHDDKMRWGITTLNGNAQQFADALCAAADELRAVMERARDA